MKTSIQYLIEDLPTNQLTNSNFDDEELANKLKEWNETDVLSQVKTTGFDNRIRHAIIHQMRRSEMENLWKNIGMANDERCGFDDIELTWITKRLNNFNRCLGLKVPRYTGDINDWLDDFNSSQPKW